MLERCSVLLQQGERSTKEQQRIWGWNPILQRLADPELILINPNAGINTGISTTLERFTNML